MATLEATKDDTKDDMMDNGPLGFEYVSSLCHTANTWKLRKPTDRELCQDVVFCAPCQVARQCRALEGHPQTFSYAYCVAVLFIFPLLPACIRVMMADKFDLDEWCMTSACKGIFCPCCSLCQTNVELKRRSYPPGTTCGFLEME